MTGYKFIDVSETVFDAVCEAAFEYPLPADKIDLVLEVLLEGIKLGRRLPISFVGISAIQITDMAISLRFRFTRNPEQIQEEEISRTGVHFIFHIIAKIDQLHRMGDTPFPDFFRHFLAFDG